MATQNYPVMPKPQRKFPVWAIVLIVVGALCFAGAGISTIAAIATTAADVSAIESAPTRPTELPPAVDAPEPKPEPTESESAPETELTVSQEQAVISAESYLENVGGFSRKGLIDQLEFEGFSKKEASFAVDYLDVNWKKQAVISAESYMEHVGGFSRQSLISQLEFEGFTTKQAEHGANAVGL